MLVNDGLCPFGEALAKLLEYLAWAIDQHYWWLGGRPYSVDDMPHLPQVTVFPGESIQKFFQGGLRLPLRHRSSRPSSVRILLVTSSAISSGPSIDSSSGQTDRSLPMALKCSQVATMSLRQYEGGSSDCH